jgi:hypothetical protein
MVQKTDAHRLLVGKRDGDHWEGMGVTVKIFKCVLKKYNGRCDWIHLAQGINMWWAIANMVVKLRFP